MHIKPIADAWTRSAGWGGSPAYWPGVQGKRFGSDDGIVFLDGGDPGITYLDTPQDRAPRARAWLKQWLPLLEKDRDKVLRAAETETGLKFHDARNMPAHEVALLLSYFVVNRTRRLPPEARHIVFGHGIGHGENWRFDKTGVSVRRFVDYHVPKGEGAWVVVCDTFQKPNLSRGEGRLVISNGR